jgi:hypothetical protein
MKLFEIGNEANHHAGDPSCPACLEPYPEPCRCGGLAHAAAGEEDPDGNPALVTRCDQCGRSQEQAEEEYSRG